MLLIQAGGSGRAGRAASLLGSPVFPIFSPPSPECRGKAKTAVDDALADVDATHEEKTARKRTLTTVPKELKAK